jgi:hypothetical protein
MTLLLLATTLASQEADTQPIQRTLPPHYLPNNTNFPQNNSIPASSPEEVAQTRQMPTLALPHRMLIFASKLFATRIPLQTSSAPTTHTFSDPPLWPANPPARTPGRSQAAAQPVVLPVSTAAPPIHSPSVPKTVVLSPPRSEFLVERGPSRATPRTATARASSNLQTSCPCAARQDQSH